MIMKVLLDDGKHSETFKILLEDEYYDTMDLRDEMINYILVRIAAFAYEYLEVFKVPFDEDSNTVDTAWLKYSEEKDASKRRSD